MGVAPVTVAPVTVAPVTVAPVTVAPVTVAPVTVAPVTVARTFSQILTSSFSNSEQTEMYGKGVKMLYANNNVDSHKEEKIPLAPNQEYLHKRGLGFSDEQNPKGLGFSYEQNPRDFVWVKGKDLVPSKDEDTMKKVMAAVDLINKRVEAERVEAERVEAERVEAERRMNIAMAKALEINKRVEAERVEAERRMNIAKTKALELNRRVEEESRGRESRGRESRGRESRGRESRVETVVFRVSRENAEAALKSAIASGFGDFRIEFLD